MTLLSLKRTPRADRPGDLLVVAADAVAVDLGGAPVLRGVDLVVHAGESIALTGANGSGKSTLLRLLATLLRPTSGTLTLFNQPLAPVDTAALRKTRRGIALIGHASSLHPDLTLAENLTLVADLADQPRARVAEALFEVGLAGAAARPTRVCSEGMKRRAEIARVLLCQPDLLLLDEAHSALDAAARSLVQVATRSVTARGGAAVLVTHDPHALAAVTDRLLTLRGGRLVTGVSA